MIMSFGADYGSVFRLVTSLCVPRRCRGQVKVELEELDVDLTSDVDLTLENGDSRPVDDGPIGAGDGLDGAGDGLNGAGDGLDGAVSAFDGACNGLEGAGNGLDGAASALDGACNGLDGADGQLFGAAAGDGTLPRNGEGLEGGGEGGRDATQQR